MRLITSFEGSHVALLWVPSAFSRLTSVLSAASPMNAYGHDEKFYDIATKILCVALLHHLNHWFSAHFSALPDRKNNFTTEARPIADMLGHTNLLVFSKALPLYSNAQPELAR